MADETLTVKARLDIPRSLHGRVVVANTNIGVAKGKRTTLHDFLLELIETGLQVKEKEAEQLVKQGNTPNHE